MAKVLCLAGVAVAMATSRDKAKAIVATMTPAEKYSWCQGYGWDGYNPTLGVYIGNTPAIDRLKLPSQNMYDGPQGWRTIERQQIDQVTSWPCALGAASTWDTDRMYDYATAIAKEFRAKGANIILGPSVDMGRVARNGRNAESIAGEDPYFASKMAVSYVKGVQDNRVLATMKHFILNNQENDRNFYNSITDERTLWEVYYPAYQAAIEQANLSSVMCSYNRVGGKYACEQGDILKRDLKGTMGFEGWVMSDWWATKSTGAANEGLDQEQPGNLDNWFDPAKLAREISMTRIDEMLANMLTPMIEHNVLDNDLCTPPNCNKDLYEVTATTAANQKLARDIAAESAVLLKNDNKLLPFGASIRTLAIVGGACDAPNPLDGTNWNDGTYYVVGGSGRVLSSRTTSIVDGIRARGGSLVLRVSLTDNVQNALNAANGADATLICGGTTSAEDYDRPDLYLDNDAFIRNFLAQATSPTVVAMSTPGPVLTEWRDEATAIVNMFLAGEATGHAWADILFGAKNPSGKLPVTFPNSAADTVDPCPSSGDCVYGEMLEIGYRAPNNNQVHFPFGHGLSYTTFQYSLDSSPARCNAVDRSICMSVKVTNTGTVSGAEVVQLYLNFPEALGEPMFVLKGFSKHTLGPGAVASVQFKLTERDLSLWDRTVRKWKVGSGNFVASIGSSSNDIRVSPPSFSVAGDISVSPAPDPDFPEVCPGGTLEKCLAKCPETPPEAFEACVLDCERLCTGSNPDYEYFEKTGCSNWQNIQIVSYPPGQGNCAAFCNGNAECDSYNFGRNGQQYQGRCSLFRKGCNKQRDPEFDLFVWSGPPKKNQNVTKKVPYLKRRDVEGAKF